MSSNERYIITALEDVNKGQPWVYYLPEDKHEGSSNFTSSPFDAAVFEDKAEAEKKIRELDISHALPEAVVLPDKKDEDEDEPELYIILSHDAEVDWDVRECEETAYRSMSESFKILKRWVVSVKRHEGGGFYHIYLAERDGISEEMLGSGKYPFTTRPEHAAHFTNKQQAEKMMRELRLLFGMLVEVVSLKKAVRKQRNLIAISSENERKAA